jgi:hypothetical protein
VGEEHERRALVRTHELLLGDDPDGAAALVEHLLLVGELHGATAG